VRGFSYIAMTDQAPNDIVQLKRPRRKQLFRATDVKNAVSGATAAGASISQITINLDGSIVLTVGALSIVEIESPYDTWSRERGKIAA